MRAGMITAAVWNFDRALGRCGNGLLSRQTMVRSSGASNASTRTSMVAPTGSRFIQRRSEATQSRASTGSPSWKRSPSRRVMVRRFPSFSISSPASICGFGFIAASRPYSVSNTIMPKLRTTIALVHTGSMLDSAACGTKFRVLVEPPIAGRASVAAAAPKRRLRRFMLCSRSRTPPTGPSGCPSRCCARPHFADSRQAGCTAASQRPATDRHAPAASVPLGR